MLTRIRFCLHGTKGHCRYYSKVLSMSESGRNGEGSKTKPYGHTLLLPKTKFPLRTVGAKREEVFRKKTTEDLYRWQDSNLGDRNPFVLHDGPPYANGALHMGHALNKILKDIINRFQVLRGRRVNYIPGWDCHGLPIETKALKELKKSARDLSSIEIRTMSRRVALREIDAQREGFKQFGIMADWSDKGTYRTLSHEYEIRQLRVFKRMVENGLITRNLKPVYWSPSSNSALAEAELTYNGEHRSHTVYVGFELRKDTLTTDIVDRLNVPLGHDRKLELAVWTTTPWTLPSNMGILVHPDMVYTVVITETGRCLVVAKDRVDALESVFGPLKATEVSLLGSELEGSYYLSAFDSSADHQYKISCATFVTSDSGTGLVHSAPGHGHEDYLVWLKSGSTTKIFSPINDEGRYTSDIGAFISGEDGENMIGKSVLGDGNKAIIDILRERGLLLKEEVIQHKYPYDWKTDKPVIVRATVQWFADISILKDRAGEALEDTKFYPPNSRSRLSSYIGERSEWCISRQRAWGVPIPALYDESTGKALLNSESLSHIIDVLEEKGVDYWWQGPVQEFIPPSLSEQGIQFVKATETMDVWFDSGTSWTLLKELGITTEQGEHQLPAWSDVALEGSDQHRGWFQSLLLTSLGDVYPRVAKPYHTVITHGFVLDEDKKKMSKSIGNIINPMTIIHGGKNLQKEPAYGAEVLRLWVASTEYWKDVNIGTTTLTNIAESLRKIRNSARFALANVRRSGTPHIDLDIPREELGLAERYMLYKLYQLEAAALDGYETYNFAKVSTALTHFANVTLSSLYFDITKDSLYADGEQSPERRNVIYVLQQILRSLTRSMAPILPHLAEEIHEVLHEGMPCAMRSCFETKWTPLPDVWNDSIIAKEMEQLMILRSEVLGLLEEARGQKRIGSSLEADVDIILPGDSEDTAITRLISAQENFLKTLFIVSDAAIVDEGSLGTYSEAWVLTSTVTLGDEETPVVCRARPAQGAKCPRCWTFTRAPENELCQRCTSVLSLPQI